MSSCLCTNGSTNTAMEWSVGTGYAWSALDIYSKRQGQRLYMQLINSRELRGQNTLLDCVLFRLGRYSKFLPFMLLFLCSS